MTDEERRRWYEMREQSQALLDTPAPEPSNDLCRPDVLEKWAAGMPPKPEPEVMKSLTPDLEPVPVPIDWAAVDERIESAIEARCAPMTEAIGEVLGESLRDMRRESADELAGEVRRLWAIVSELQCTIASLVRVGIGKAEPLDLPRLPRGRDHDLN